MEDRTIAEGRILSNASSPVASRQAIVKNSEATASQPSLGAKGMIPERRGDGMGIAFSFNAAHASERGDLQYFEMFCNKGIAKTSRFSGKINWVRSGATVGRR